MPTHHRWLSLKELVVAGCLLLGCPLHALNPSIPVSNLTLQSWTRGDGLPAVRVDALHQTRDGYLWVGTNHRLGRFDGLSFLTLSRGVHPELSHPQCNALAEGPDGALWVGTSRGLIRLHRDRAEHLTTEQGLPRNHVFKLAFKRDGDLFVGSTGGKTCLIRDGQVVSAGDEWSRLRGNVRAYLERPDGREFVAAGGTLWQMAGGRSERVFNRKTFTPSDIFALADGPSRTLWIGSNLGLRCLHADGRVEDYRIGDGQNSHSVRSLLFDRDGTLWIGTDHGLYFRRAGNIASLPHKSELRKTAVQHMYEDREGSVWFATPVALYRLKDTPIQSIVHSGKGTVSILREARDGGFWIAVGNNTYRHRSSSNAEPLVLPADMARDRIRLLHEDSEGTLWIGSEEGLKAYRNGTVIDYYDRRATDEQRARVAANPGVVLPKIVHPDVNAIEADGQGGLWIGTNGALYHYRKGDFRAYTPAQGLPHPTIRALRRTRDGTLWIATKKGAAQWHDGRFTTEMSPGELLPHGAHGIFEDQIGDIWLLGEGGGIHRRSGGRWRTYTKASGLHDDAVSGMLEDDTGHLWFGTAIGIMRLPRRQFDDFDAGRVPALQPRVFTKSDGMPSSSCILEGSPNVWKSSDGRLHFTTAEGVAVIRPEDIAPPIVPSVHLERVRINDKQIDPGQAVVIPPGDNRVEISYTAISLLRPESVRFKIRLAPRDRDWIDVGDRRDVHYSNLPPGDYAFHVIATAGDGAWNEQGAGFALSVQPFFYQTRWFIVSALLAAGSTIFSAFWMRVRLVRRRMTMLTRLVDERTRELKLAKDAAEAAVAALQQAQEATARERARFKFIFDGVPVGVAWMIEGRGDSRIVNPAHAQITGLPLEHACDVELYWEATHPKDRAREETLHRDLLAGRIDHYHMEKRFTRADGSECWAALTARLFHDSTSGVRQEICALVDITDRKLAERRLAETHRKLLDISRRAGMAEVATDVLHNVGNVLNSVSVSATLIADNVRHSKAAQVAKLSALVREHAADLGRFFTEDSRGRAVPSYLASLAEHLGEEQRSMIAETDSLRANLEHIKQIVARQQDYARVSGVTETLSVAELIEDALGLSTASSRDEVEIVRDVEARSLVTVEKHKLLQILVNLIQNAKRACDDSGRSDKRITVKIVESDGRVRVEVSDNGIGILAENLTRIFNHGFTTRKGGHGFGLHSCALAAKELGGSLHAYSEGKGRGATFVLELPTATSATDGANSRLESTSD